METSINNAISKGYFQQIRFLVLERDVNERDPKDGRTPLIKCAFVEDTSWGVGLARNLIENGALVRLRDRRGLNAMHYACIFNRVELAKVFLNAIDFDLKQGDKLGNTALHYAVTENNAALAKVLVAAHVRYKVTVDTENKQGVTPLLEAYRTENVDFINLLVEIGGADDDCQEIAEFKLAKRSGSVSTSRSSSLETLEDESTMFVPRPMTARFRASHARATSAPLLKRRRRSVTLSSGSLMSAASDAEKENNKYITRDKLIDKLYRTASDNNLHNRPDYLLQVSPIEFFSRRQEGHVVRPVTSASSERRRGNAFTWRGEMKRLYTVFDFQFTGSYRKSARPPPEIHLETASSQDFNARPVSPNPSECPSDSTGASRRSHRRGSIQKPALEVKRMSKVLSGLQPRRSSALSPKGGSSYSDSSESSEGYNASSVKKRASLEGKEDLSTDGLRSHDKGDKGGPRSRPGSSKSSLKGKPPLPAAADNSGSSGDPPQRPQSRTGHYTPTAATNVSSNKEEKQLHIIKE